MARPAPDQELWVAHGASGEQAPAVALIPVTGGHAVSVTDSQWAALQVLLTGLSVAAASAPVEQAVMQAVGLLTTAQGNSIATTTQAVGVTAGQIHQDLIAVIGALEEIRDGTIALPGLIGSAPSAPPQPGSSPIAAIAPAVLNGGNPLFNSAAPVGFASQPFIPVPAGAKAIELSLCTNQHDALATVAVQCRRVAGSNSPADQSFSAAEITTNIITATPGEFAADRWVIPVHGPEIRVSLQSVSGGAMAKLYARAY